MGVYESAAMKVAAALLFASYLCAKTLADCDPPGDFQGRTYSGISDIPSTDPDGNGDPLGTTQWCLKLQKGKDVEGYGGKIYMTLSIDASIDDNSCTYENRPIETIGLAPNNLDLSCSYRFGTEAGVSWGIDRNWTHKCTGKASSEMMIGYGYVDNYLQDLIIQGATNGSARYFDLSQTDNFPTEMVINSSSWIGLHAPNVTLTYGDCTFKSNSSSGMSTAIIVLIIVAVVLVVGVIGIGGYCWWKKKSEEDALAASTFTPSLMNNPHQAQQQEQQQNDANANKGKWGV